MSRNSYCNSGPGASAYNGNGAQGPASRIKYLDVKLNEYNALEMA